MAPRPLVHVLGLCNVVAGALLAFGPSLVAPLDGVHAPAARLFAASGGLLLVTIAIGAWRMPPAGLRSYLWLFGVGVKVAAALVWGAAASLAAVPTLWSGALLDLGVAAIIAIGLARTGP